MGVGKKGEGEARKRRWMVAREKARLPIVSKAQLFRMLEDSRLLLS